MHYVQHSVKLKQLKLHNPRRRKILPFYHFQQIQRMQPNFMTDTMRNLTHTVNNRNNPKLRIFSFIPPRQPPWQHIHGIHGNPYIQHDFKFDTIGFFIRDMPNGENTNSEVFTFKLHKEPTS